jgi:hypothetical protein
MYGCSEQTATSKTCVLGVQVYLTTFQIFFHKNNNSGNEISVEQSLVILVLEQGWTISFVICPNKKTVQLHFINKLHFNFICEELFEKKVVSGPNTEL